jgi:hypothetical protein
VCDQQSPEPSGEGAQPEGILPTKNIFQREGENGKDWNRQLLSCAELITFQFDALPGNNNDSLAFAEIANALILRLDHLRGVSVSK